MSKKKASPPQPWFTPASIIVIMALLGVIVGLVAAITVAPAAPETSTAQHQPAESVERPTFRIINGHEHLYKTTHLPKYLRAASLMGVDQTVFVASSSATFLGADGKQDELYDWNTQEILDAASQNPGKIIPFCTIHPSDPDKLAKLQQYVAKGVKGLKLYTGHSDFHDRSLNVPEMFPIYEYCQRINLPICWHIRLGSFEAEFREVMEQFPNLTVIIPHFGVTFYRPDTEFARLPELFSDYPNVYVDTSFGTRSILVHGLEIVTDNVDIFREFFRTHADRIIFGTDMVVTGNVEKTEPWVEAVIRACRDVLEKDTYHFYMAAKASPYALARENNIYGELRGLNLPNDVLEKVYSKNWLEILERIQLPELAQ